MLGPADHVEPDRQHRVDERVPGDQRVAFDNRPGGGLIGVVPSFRVDELPMRRGERDVGCPAKRFEQSLHAGRRQQVVVAKEFDELAARARETLPVVGPNAEAHGVHLVADGPPIAPGTNDLLDLGGLGVVTNDDLDVAVGLRERAVEAGTEKTRAVGGDQDRNQRIADDLPQVALGELEYRQASIGGWQSGECRTATRGDRRSIGRFQADQRGEARHFGFGSARHSGIRRRRPRIGRRKRPAPVPRHDDTYQALWPEHPATFEQQSEERRVGGSRGRLPARYDVGRAIGKGELVRRRDGHVRIATRIQSDESGYTRSIGTDAEPEARLPRHRPDLQRPSRCSVATF